MRRRRSASEAGASTSKKRTPERARRLARVSKPAPRITTWETSWVAARTSASR
jgi:hypothetical protein